MSLWRKFFWKLDQFVLNFTTLGSSLKGNISLTLCYPFCSRVTLTLETRVPRTLQALHDSSYLFGSNAPFIEGLYEQYLQDPRSVTAEWRSWFDELGTNEPNANGHGRTQTHAHVVDQAGTGAALRSTVTHRYVPESAVRSSMAPVQGTPTDEWTDEAASKQSAVLRLINAHRVRGHLAANIDPLGLREKPELPDLSPEFHGLQEADYNECFNTGSLVAPDQMPLADILRLVKRVYCGSIGFEYMNLTSTDEKRWIQQRIEQGGLDTHLPANERRHVLERLMAAEGLERHLHTRYVGQKRFSLEGGESVIPALDSLINRAGEAGIKEIAIGMAHRGRLNVLVNVLGKPPSELYTEFEGKHDTKGFHSSGDVKYHQGYSSQVGTEGGVVHLVLGFNPSHLEIVYPVLEGSVRARQVRRGDTEREEVLPVILHGDAAITGQGVVSETLNMSDARGFRTGGTIHLVINNQIGFTTSNPFDSRSTWYCTEVAKMVEAPIMHVNGDDPDAVVFAMRMAFDYRKQFHKDVMIDLVCYRRHGHNEADEPSVTQPLMYQAIKQQITTRALYAERLIEDGDLDQQTLDEMTDALQDKLDRGDCLLPNLGKGVENEFAVDWCPYRGTSWETPVDTTVPEDLIEDLSERMLALPKGFKMHGRVAKVMEARRQMAQGAHPIDWGYGEIIAYASLLHEGYQIRLTGQDSERGTFFHRHVALHDADTGEEFKPLKNLFEGQPKFTVVNSVLSEEAVLAYEYGYATAEPEALVIWEAQFGDFANGAQVVIDQFITSGEAKWGHLCGLVMMLPHGLEGQGPEHSSARLERYLQLSAEQNIQVCVPTLPAQMFHLLRRQMLRPYRKPLVILTPKSLLRHKLSVSHLDDLQYGAFLPIIDEVDPFDASQVQTLILCSGKVYFDLLEERRKRQLTDRVIVRIEQLYPFPDQALQSVLSRYNRVKEIVWCQEEPMNQGAWYQIQHRLQAHKKPRQTLRYAGRTNMAAPAAGYLSLHLECQQKLVDEALS